MYFGEVEEFYQTLVSSEHFNEKLKNKLQKMHDEKEYKLFVQDELIPLAKTMGYDLSVDDILSYEYQKLQRISEEELESVTGGTEIMKNLTVTFISALALAGGVYVVQTMNSAQAVKPTAGVARTEESRKKADLEEFKKLVEVDESKMAKDEEGRDYLTESSFVKCVKERKDPHIDEVSIFDDKTRGTVAEDMKTVERVLDGEDVFAKDKNKRLYEGSMGSMVAMAIADAMGHRFEFQPVCYDAKEGDPGYLKDMGEGPGGKFGLQPGQWTDDTSMALCIADSLLLNKGRLQPNHLMHLFMSWWIYGFDNAFRLDEDHWRSCGLGGNISASFEEYMKRAHSYTIAGDKNTSGNGSVMRNAPVPICFHNDVGKALEVAANQSRVTHQGIEAADCCRLLTFLEIELLKEQNQGKLKEVFDNLGENFSRLVPDCCESVKCLAQSKAELNRDGSVNEDRNWNWKVEKYQYSPSRKDRNPGYIGSYAMDAMAMALHVLYHTDNLKEAILKIVNMKGDSDSVGSVVGQLAGAYYGIRSIPKDWLNTLARWDEHEIALRGYMLARLSEGESCLDSTLSDVNGLLDVPKGSKRVVDFSEDSKFHYRGERVAVESLPMRSFITEKLFKNDPKPSDVVQTTLRDVSLIAALDSIVCKCPDKLMGSIRDSGDGEVYVRLYQRYPGFSPIYYRMSKCVPEYYVSRDDGTQGALWVRMFEKAFVVHRGKFSRATQDRVSINLGEEFDEEHNHGNYSNIADGSPVAFMFDILGPDAIEEIQLTDRKLYEEILDKGNEYCLTCMLQFDEWIFICSVRGVEVNQSRPWEKLVVVKDPLNNLEYRLPIGEFLTRCLLLNGVRYSK